MRPVLVGKKLDVVNQQQIQRVVALFEIVKSLALVGFNHIRDKLLGMDVENFGGRVVGQQLIADGMHQVRLSQADSAVDKEGVVKLAQTAGHVHGRSAAHAVGGSFNERVKSQRGVEPVFKGRVKQVLSRHQPGRLGRT